MQPKLVRYPAPVLWRPRLALVALALGVSLPRDSAFAAVPNASTVEVAPIVEKPLPPPADNEDMGQAPSPKHVWVPGHYTWQDGAYVWDSGRWELPPNEGASWVQPRWETRPNGYVLIEGTWRNSPPPSAPAVAVASAPPPVAEMAVGPSEPPPPPPNDVRIERASADLVWIPGYWIRRGGRYVWVEGRWDRPPRRNVVWVEPRWERRGRDYVFVEGYWRDGTPPVVVGPGPGPGREVVIVNAPPPPRREVRYAQPGPGYVWIGGYWSWTGGRHVWIAGHWTLPPRGYRTWEEPRWDRRGGNYVFIEGRWR